MVTRGLLHYDREAEGSSGKLRVLPLHLTWNNWNQPLLVKKSQGWYVTNDLVGFKQKTPLLFETFFRSQKHRSTFSSQAA